jgi:hypothetical protein
MTEDFWSLRLIEFAAPLAFLGLSSSGIALRTLLKSLA